MVGQNGGSAFILIFILFCLSIGLVLFLAEMMLGKSTRDNLANSYFKTAKFYPKYMKFGAIAMLSGIFVLSFYLIILSWVFQYLFYSFSLPNTNDKALELFKNAVSSNVKINILCFLFCLFCTLYFVKKGIVLGIERLNVVLMPLLCLIMIFLLFYSVSEGAFVKAIKFIFYPDFSKLNFKSILDALGLSLFTLCLGIGCISTYAANSQEDTNILKASLLVIFLNITIGLLMAVVVFAFAFAFLSDENLLNDAALVFVSLNVLFSKLGLIGNILAFLFFLALFFAGITSAVSMIEPFTFYLEKKIGRNKSILYIGIIVFILGLSCIFSMCNIIKIDVFYILDFLTSNIMLPVGVFFTSIFLGFFANKIIFIKILRKFMKKRLIFLYFTFVKYICPIIIILVFINNFYPLSKLLN